MSSQAYWSAFTNAIRATSPLVKVLRLVDSERKPVMGYIYKSMEMAKELIREHFHHNFVKYEELEKIIDARWSIQLHRPLHAAGYLLNSGLFYHNAIKIYRDPIIHEGILTCISVLVTSRDEQNLILKQLTKYKDAVESFGIDFATRNRTKISLGDEQNLILKQLTKYKDAMESFGTDFATRNRTKISPVERWITYGHSTLELRILVIRILRLTCSACGCERNWSVLEQIHNKKRNRLEQKRLNDYVFVKYNKSLVEHFEARDIIDPISLVDLFDEANEWMIGQMDEFVNVDNDVVQEDDTLPWELVADAMGDDEPRVRTRSTIGKASISWGRSSGRGGKVTLRLQDEDIDEEETQGQEVEVEHQIEENLSLDIDPLEEDEDVNIDQNHDLI